MQCDAVCCSMLHYVAVCCSVLQCDAVCCCVLQCDAVCCSVLQSYSDQQPCAVRGASFPQPSVFDRKSLVVYQRNPTFYQHALHSIKRALHPLKRALYSIKNSPVFELYIPSKKPCIPSKEFVNRVVYFKSFAFPQKSRTLNQKSPAFF